MMTIFPADCEVIATGASRSCPFPVVSIDAKARCSPFSLPCRPGPSSVAGYLHQHKAKNQHFFILGLARGSEIIQENINNVLWQNPVLLVLFGISDSYEHATQSLHGAN